MTCIIRNICHESRQKWSGTIKGRGSSGKLFVLLSSQMKLWENSNTLIVSLMFHTSTALKKFKNPRISTKETTANQWREFPHLSRWAWTWTWKISENFYSTPFSKIYLQFFSWNVDLFFIVATKNVDLRSIWNYCCLNSWSSL